MMIALGTAVIGTCPVFPVLSSISRSPFSLFHFGVFVAQSTEALRSVGYRSPVPNIGPTLPQY